MWILLQPRSYLPHSYELFYERNIPAADLVTDYAPAGPVRVFQAESLKALGPCSDRQDIDYCQLFFCIRLNAPDQIPLKVIRRIGDSVS